MNERKPRAFECQQLGCPGMVQPTDPGPHYGRQWIEPGCNTCGRQPTLEEVEKYGWEEKVPDNDDGE